jgi:hypothetical protein
MKFNQLFEVKNELGFDEKYTREDNPEVYSESINFSYEKLSSFDGFPRLIKSEYIHLSDTLFTDLEGFPEFESDEAAKECNLSLSYSHRLTSLRGRTKIY